MGGAFEEPARNGKDGVGWPMRALVPSTQSAINLGLAARAEKVEGSEDVAQRGGDRSAGEG